MAWFRGFSAEHSATTTHYVATYNTDQENKIETFYYLLGKINRKVHNLFETQDLSYVTPDWRVCCEEPEPGRKHK